MAFTGNIGTVITSSTQNDELTGRYVIQAISWVGNSSVGDEAIVSDGAGTAIFDGTGSQTDDTITRNYTEGLFVDGIKITKLESGAIQITMR